jgi:hypothetical protein
MLLLTRTHQLVHILQPLLLKHIISVTTLQPAAAGNCQVIIIMHDGRCYLQ